MRRFITALAATSLLSSALAQSGREALVLLVDPSSAESLRFANEYAAAHGVADVQRLYIAPGASDIVSQFGINVEGFLGHLVQSGLETQIDGVLAMPGSSLYVSAGGFVSDPLCTGPALRSHHRLHPGPRP